jgi:hypothetical protein
VVAKRRKWDSEPSLSGAWRMPIPASGSAKGDEGFVLLLGRDHVAIRDR